MITTQPKPFDSSTFESLKNRHQELADSVPSLAEQRHGDTPCPTWMIKIDDFIDDVRELVAHARELHQLEPLAWAARIANHWQVAMTSVFGIPTDIRGRIGIKPRDVFAETSIWKQGDLEQYITSQANGIGANRKLLHLLEQLQFYSLHPDQIHTEIQSSEEERLDDWGQACAFLALDVITQRVNVNRMEICGRTLEILDSVFLEDVVQLDAYLAWESSHVGWAPERSKTFHETAEERVRAEVCSPKSSSAELNHALIDWFKDRLQIPDRSNSLRRAHVERKAERIWLHARQSDSSNWRTAQAQSDLFDQNVVLALNEQNQQSIRAVAESVLGNENSMFRYCATALEAVVFSHFIDKPCSILQ